MNTILVILSLIGICSCLYVIYKDATNHENYRFEFKREVLVTNNDAEKQELQSQLNLSNQKLYDIEKKYSVCLDEYNSLQNRFYDIEKLCEDYARSMQEAKDILLPYIKENAELENTNSELEDFNNELVDRYTLLCDYIGTPVNRSQFVLSLLCSEFPAVKEYVDYVVNTFVTPESTLDRWLEPQQKELSIEEQWQKAVENYQRWHNRKSDWEKGRDYEMYVADVYRRKGYEVQCTGIEQKLMDLGRDIIATNEERTLIIQCKCWSHRSQVYPKYIAQLYGTAKQYETEHGGKVIPLFITSTSLSPTAKEVAEKLHVTVEERHEIRSYPCIKCNINNGRKIFHLPFDPQYDRTKIKDDGEFYAWTVQEAMAAGFVRAHTTAGHFADFDKMAGEH